MLLTCGELMPLLAFAIRIQRRTRQLGYRRLPYPCRRHRDLSFAPPAHPERTLPRQSQHFKRAPHLSRRLRRIRRTRGGLLRTGGKLLPLPSRLALRRKVCTMPGFPNGASTRNAADISPSFFARLSVHLFAGAVLRRSVPGWDYPTTSILLDAHYDAYLPQDFRTRERIAWSWSRIATAHAPGAADAISE